MKRFLQLLMLAILGVMFILPAQAIEMVSNSITVKVETNTPTIADEGVTTQYKLIYQDQNESKTVYYQAKVKEDKTTEAPRPTVDGCSFTPDTEGYVFDYWSSGTSTYAPGSAIELIADSDVILTAHYTESAEKKTTSYITYHDKDGNTSESDKINNGSEIQLSGLPSKLKTPDGYKFVGWDTSSSGASVVYSAGQSVRIDGGNNDLYAVFTPVKKGARLSINKWITNKKWDSDGKLRRFKVGDTVKFEIVVTNTGDENIPEVVVYDGLKGAKIKKGGGYDVSGGDAYIYNLNKGETVYVKATYTIKSSDIGKHHLSNTAGAWSNKTGEVTASCHIPVSREKGYTPTYTTTITVYADSSISQPLNRIVSDFELDYPDYYVNVVYGSNDTTVSSLVSYGGSDVIITVGKDSMNRLDSKQGGSNRITSSTRITPFENRGALVGRSGTVIKFSQLKTALTSGKAKLAICTDSSDMATQFAKDIASSLVLDMSTLKATGAVIECATSAEVAQAVLNGTADLGIMSGSGAVSYGLTTADVASDGICTPVAYPAAVLRGTSHSTAAQTFVTYLRDSESRAAYTEYGYTAK